MELKKKNLENIKKYKECEDKKIFDEIVRDNYALIYSIAKKFKSIDIEDSIQLASLGLVKSVIRFNLDIGCEFSTYAVPMIEGEIKKFIRDKSRLIKIPRSVMSLWFKISNLNSKGITDVKEISKKLDVSTKEIEYAIKACSTIDSLDRELKDDDNNKPTFLGDLIESNTESEERIVSRIDLKNALDELSDKYKYIIKRRYFDNKTQNELAYELGLSQVQISRLEKKILVNLKNIMEGKVMSKKDSVFEWLDKNYESCGLAGENLIKKIKEVHKLSTSTVVSYLGTWRRINNKSIGKKEISDRSKVFEWCNSNSDVASNDRKRSLLALSTIASSSKNSDRFYEEWRKENITKEPCKETIEEEYINKDITTRSDKVKEWLSKNFNDTKEKFTDVLGRMKNDIGYKNGDETYVSEWMADKKYIGVRSEKEVECSAVCLENSECDPNENKLEILSIDVKGKYFSYSVDKKIGVEIFDAPPVVTVKNKEELKCIFDEIVAVFDLVEG